MCGLTAQHHALSYGHLHPVRAKLHTHGLCKHKTAALSPQANPDFLWRCSIWLWTTWKSENETQTETKRTFNTITLKSRWGLVHVWDLYARCYVCPCVIWFFSVRALLHGWTSTINFLAAVPRKRGGWHWGLFPGGELSLIWQKIKSLQGTTYLSPTVQRSSPLSQTGCLPDTHSSPHLPGWS